MFTFQCTFLQFILVFLQIRLEPLRRVVFHHALVDFAIEIPALEYDEQSAVLGALPEIFQVDLAFLYRLLLEFAFHLVLRESAKGQPRVASVISDPRFILGRGGGPVRCRHVKYLPELKMLRLVVLVGRGK